MDTTPFLLWRLPLLTKMMDCYRHPSYLGNLMLHEYLIQHVGTQVV